MLGAGFLTIAWYRRKFQTFILLPAVLLVALSFIVVNFLIDLAYGWLDPRIRYA